VRWAPGIVAQVVVLDGATAALVDPHAHIPVPVNTVAAERGVAAPAYRDAGEGVREYVVVFNRPLAVLVDKDAALLAIVDTVAAERGVAALAYLHAGITGAATLGIAFGLALAGPEYLTSFLGGNQWGGAVGPDPLIFWLVLTVVLVLIGGAGSHRVSALLRHAREYRDRLTAIERALWDARVLVRERREKV
jgi:hypothetical protein